MPAASKRLIVFAKAPERGTTKTRLIPLLGADGAAALHETLVDYTLANAAKFISAGVRLELHATRVDDGFVRATARRHGATLLRQVDGDLGTRMHTACAAALRDSRQVVLIGSDCPALGTHHVAEAFRALEQKHDAVFCPTEDGGYALIGLGRCDQRLFMDIAWSTSSVMAETRLRVNELGWRHIELETLWDVDRPDDYRRLVASGMPGPEAASGG
jgi:uncharacterized protein